MIKIVTYEPDYDVIPQAIFWRPLRWFTFAAREGEDGLDNYRGASFVIGNQVRFDLRTYRGHPQFTVTLYLPEGIENAGEIATTIRIVIKTMIIPAAAVAWRRGDDFQMGTELRRPRSDRLRETEARILALKIASQQPNRSASTQAVKREVPNYIELSKIDLQPSPTRRREAMWQQIIGNVISHQDSSQGPFVKGYATRTPNGLSVTDKGMAYLNSIGFLS